MLNWSKHECVGKPYYEAEVNGKGLIHFTLERKGSSIHAIDTVEGEWQLIVNYSNQERIWYYHDYNNAVEEAELICEAIIKQRSKDAT